MRGEELFFIRVFCGFEFVDCVVVEVWVIFYYFGCEEIFKLFFRKVIESFGLECSFDNIWFVGGSKKLYWLKFLIKNFSCICVVVLKILKFLK